MSQFQSLKNNPKEPIGFSSFNFQCKLIGHQGSPDGEGRLSPTPSEPKTLATIGAWNPRSNLVV